MRQSLAPSAVARPVIFAVLTTVVAFAPWAFLSGPQSEFFTSSFSGHRVCARVFVDRSLFSILPAHLRHLASREESSKGFALQRFISSGITSFASNTYAPLLERALKIRYALSAVFLAGFIVAIALVTTGWVRFYFFPQLESETLRVDVGLPSGVPFTRTEAVMDQLNSASDDLKAQYPVVGGLHFCLRKLVGAIHSITATRRK